MMSVEDVTFVVNSNLYSDEQISEKEVQLAMKSVARGCAEGYRYNELRKTVIDLGCDFFQYGK